MAQTVKRLSTMQETWVGSLGWEDPLEKEMAIHSRTIAWKIPWTEEPGRLYSPWGRKESDTTERLHFLGTQPVCLRPEVQSQELLWAPVGQPLTSPLSCPGNRRPFCQAAFLCRLLESPSGQTGAGGPEPVPGHPTSGWSFYCFWGAPQRTGSTPVLPGCPTRIVFRSALPKNANPRAGSSFLSSSDPGMT